MWIKSYQEIGEDPRTKKLARLLKIPRVQAVGHFHYLLWWAASYAPDGNLSTRHDVDEIADGAKWEEDPEQFISALIECGKPGYLIQNDGQLLIYEWDRYMGKSTQSHPLDRNSELRKAYQNGTIDKVRQRDHDHCRYCGKVVDWPDRKTAGGGTYDWIDPNGPTSVDNIVVSCRGCSTKKNNRSPEESEMRVLSLDDIHSSSDGISNESLKVSNDSFNDTSNDGSNDSSNASSDSSNDHLIDKIRIDKNRKIRIKDLKILRANARKMIRSTSDETIASSSQEDSETLNAQPGESTPPNTYPDTFEEFWLIYPRKLDKKKAYHAWTKRLREKTNEGDQSVTVDMLIQCASHYAQTCQINHTDEKFIKHPSSFLGPTHPFEDYLLAPRAAPTSSGSKDDPFEEALKVMENMRVLSGG